MPSVLISFYISQNFIMARCAAFERSKFDQILKITSISPKRLAYAILSFPLSFCLDFSLVLGFVGCSDI